MRISLHTQVKVLMCAHLLHKVLISLLDAGVWDWLLRVANGVDNISLATLPLTTVPAAQKQHG